jgi:hypothetical protein
MSNFIRSFKPLHNNQLANQNASTHNMTTNVNSQFKSSFSRVPFLKIITLSNVRYNRLIGLNEIEYRRSLFMYPLHQLKIDF